VSSTEYISLSRDGSLIVTRRHFDGCLFVIDTNTRQTISSFKPDTDGWFQLTPTGKELAMRAKNRRSVIFYDLETWRPVRETREVPERIIRFALSPDGSAVAISYVGGGLLACSLHDNRPIVDRKGTEKICYLAWSRDSTMLAFANETFNGIVLSTATGDQVYEWKLRNPSGLDFTSEGILITGDNPGSLYRIDVGAQAIQKLAGVKAAPVMAISAAPNGSIVSVGRGDGAVELWDIIEGRKVASATGHVNSVGVSKYVECIQWFPDGRRLCTWGGYDTRIWSISLPSARGSSERA
jgi:WD40 repeat protein